MAGGKAKITPANKYTGKKGFGAFIYDSDEGTVFGRTAGSWLKITVFYIIFYICLAGFFLLNYYLFSFTLMDDQPRWLNKDSLIGDKPGIGFRPKPDPELLSDSTLIWFQSGKESDYRYWVNELNATVNASTLSFGPDQAGLKDCSYASPASKTEACRIKPLDTTNYGNCIGTEGKTFGYSDGQPCVYIKLNKIFGWAPEGYGIDKDKKFDKNKLTEDLNKLVTKSDENPNPMPASLKNHILDQVAKNVGKEVDILSTVWFTCSGETISDKESLPDTSITYYPTGIQGIPGYFFPYENIKKFKDGKEDPKGIRLYQSPFMMVQFKIPEKSRHVLINIECRAWANNIDYDRITKKGAVHFELMVD